MKTKLEVKTERRRVHEEIRKGRDKDVNSSSETLQKVGFRSIFLTSNNNNLNSMQFTDE